MNYKIILLMIIIFYSIIFHQKTIAQNSGLSSEEINKIIEQHNFWRAQVGVGKLQWSDVLAKQAQSWANQLRDDGCLFKHSNCKYGENIFKGTTGYYTAIDAIDDWASEKTDYNYKKNKCKKVCGHYTQIVWAKTTHVGCAKAECNGFNIWVCNYNPPGNYIGQNPY